MTSAETSIFISHVNDDPDAETVLKALVDEQHGLMHELGPDYDAYEIAYDREIVVGKEWRSTIYAWLVDCAAAVVLVSKQAFDPDKPWVSHEATVLTITQTLRRDLCIIPVLLEGTEDLLNRRPAFKPGRLAAIQALRYPNRPRLIEPTALVTAIAERLKQELPPRDMRPLIGLAAQLRDAILEFPESARKASAACLDPSDITSDATLLAKRLLEADESRMQQAFYALCDRAREARFFDTKMAIAGVLGAQRVREAVVKPFVVETARPCNSECGYDRRVPKGMLGRGWPSAAERLAIGSDPP